MRKDKSYFKIVFLLILSFCILLPNLFLFDSSHASQHNRTLLALIATALAGVAAMLVFKYKLDGHNIVSNQRNCSKFKVNGDMKLDRDAKVKIVEASVRRSSFSDEHLVNLPSKSKEF